MQRAFANSRSRQQNAASESGGLKYLNDFSSIYSLLTFTGCKLSLR